MARVIGIVSGKGGVGKTTLVSNLGVILSKEFKKSVVLVDCNITTSHLSLHVGMYYSPVTLNDVLRKDAKLDEAIYEHSSGVKIIPASLTFKNLEGADLFKLKGVIKNLVKKTDIIILDSSPGLGREAMAVLKNSQEVIYVATPFFTSVMDIVRCREALESLGEKSKSIGIVLNMVRGEENELSLSEIESFTGLQVIASIPFDKNVYRSLFAGAPVYLWKPYSKASREMIKLAAKLIGEEYKENRIKVFLNSIFRR